MTEDKIEAFALGHLQAMKYGSTHVPTIAHDGEQPERESYEQVLLLGRLQEAIKRIKLKMSAFNRRKVLASRPCAPVQILEPPLK